MLLASAMALELVILPTNSNGMSCPHHAFLSPGLSMPSPHQGTPMVFLPVIYCNWILAFLPTSYGASQKWVG